MPAYYCIQLYKSPIELDIESIVQRAIEGLIDVGCDYQFSSITKIEDDSLPQGQQRPITNIPEFNTYEAINYAVKDIQAWRTTEKDKKWLPGITIIFEFDFLFDPEITEKLDSEKLKRVKQVKLDFWVKEDKFFGDKIVISLDTWEEYILMYGQQKTHLHNKKQILKMVESICDKIVPHYGWLDSELNSYGASYDSVDADDWLVGNEFVIVGPQLVQKISKDNLEATSNFFKKLAGGCMFFRSSYYNAA